MTGIKYDGEKPMMHLLPPKAINEVAKVLTFGAQKYDEENWRKLDNSGISRTVRPMVLASAGLAACSVEEKIEREAIRVRNNILWSFMERIRKSIIK